MCLLCVHYHLCVYQLTDRPATYAGICVYVASRSNVACHIHVLNQTCLSFCGPLQDAAKAVPKQQNNENDKENAPQQVRLCACVPCVPGHHLGAS